MSHWYMFDNHTFQRLSDNPTQAVEDAMKCFDKDPWGTVFTKDPKLHPFNDNLSSSGGINARGKETRERFRKDLDQWAENLIQNHYSKGAGI